MDFRKTILLFLFFATTVVQTLSAETDDSVSVEIKDFVLLEDSSEIENLKRENYEDIDDLLMFYPGIDLTNLGYPGQFMNFNYRGLNHKGISISIDGIPIESDIFGTSDINLFPVEIMDRVYLSRYSVFSPGYLDIDFKTKSNPDDEPFTRVVYRMGDYEKSFVDVFFKRKLTSISDIAFSGNFEKYPGQVGNDNYFRRRFWLSYKRSLSKNICLKFSGILLKSGVDLPSEIPTTKMLVSRNAREDNNSGLYNLTLTRTNESSNLDVYLYFNRFINKFRNIVKNASDITVNDDKENILGTGFSYTKILNNGMLTAKFNLSAYSINRSIFPEIKNKKKISTFLNYRYILKNRIIIEPHFSIFNDDIRGSINAGGINIYSPVSEKFGTFLSYRTSGRYPNICELYHNGIKTDLKNEKFDSMELGMDYKLRNNFIKWSFYRQTVNDMIRYGIYSDEYSIAFGRAFNDKKYSYYGINIDLSSTFLKFFQIFARYSYTKNNEVNPFLYNPESNGYFSFVINDIEDIFTKSSVTSMIKFSCRYLGEEYMKYYSPYIRDFALSGVLTEPSVIFNLKTLVKISTFTFIYEIDNIIGEDFVEVYGYPVPKGAVRIGLQWDFFD